jgi:type II secretory pathway pseudopilin PulG
LREHARQVALVCVGALSAAVARTELGSDARAVEAAAGLREQAASLARRARATEADAALAAPDAEPPQHDAGLDGVALQGLALGLRKVDHALRALGH